MRGLLRDRRGVSAIEFAVLAPVAVLIVTAGFEGFALHAGGIALETAAAAAARAGAIGALGAQDRNAALRAILMQRLCPEGGTVCYLSETPLPMGDDGVVAPLRMTFRSYVDPRNMGVAEPFSDTAPENGRWDAGETFIDANGNGRWDPDMGRATLGGSGDFVTYEIAIAQDVRHPALVAALGSPLVRTVSFTVRNEPF
jgi:Flp pilus assembly pilin Flp